MLGLQGFGPGVSAAKRGQTSIEVISIAVAMTILLLIVLIATYNRNAQTQEMLVFNQNNIQCSEISSSIARIYSNRGITSETLQLDYDANFLRVEGKPGSISIGRISCFYVGSVSYGGLEDVDGIDLTQGDWCFEKGTGEIVMSVGPCS